MNYSEQRGRSAPVFPARVGGRPRCSPRPLLVLLLGLALGLLGGCSHYDKGQRRQASYSVVGPLSIAYIGSISKADQALGDKSARLHIQEYERVTGYPAPWVVVHVLIGRATMKCGLVKLARGCYESQFHRILVAYGVRGELPWLLHEMEHARGNWHHIGPIWALINAADLALQALIKMSRGWVP